MIAVWFSPGLRIVAVIAVATLLLIMSLEAGFRWGRRSFNREGPKAGGGELGAIQGAILGLLALLLGFSFAGAASRFMERQDLIIQEANAIGTAYLRADMLDEPFRSDLRDALADYLKHRIRVSDSLARGITPEILAEVDRFHDRIWAAASAGTNAKASAMVAVLPPVNETLDLHATRLAVSRKHLPALVIGLLLACVFLAIGIIGYGCGLTGRRNLIMTSSLVLLLAASLWMIVDLDYPRIGLIQLSDAPLKELDQALSAQH